MKKPSRVVHLTCIEYSFDAPSKCVALCACRSSQETLSERVRALQKDIATLQADRE